MDWYLVSSVICIALSIVFVFGAKNRLLKEQLNHLEERHKKEKENTEMVFKKLASDVLGHTTESFSRDSREKLTDLLGPLKSKLNEFRENVDKKYENEQKERFALKKEIETLAKTSARITTEASSLARALRGDSKVQGDWGELILERILEDSGLQKGSDFHVQKTYRNETGDRFRPDVVVRMPQNTQIVIDSKVSLTYYDQYLSEDTTDKKEILKNFIKSIENHIGELAGKNYDKLEGISSPELVFMFIPIESAYFLAMQTSPSLLTHAWRQRIVIVTSTTLLATIKTVASVWRLEKQNKNALEIANEGARLYDKFAGFLEDFTKMENSLKNCQSQYEAAKRKLRDGPGSVFRKMEYLKELGISAKKKIPSELSD